MKLIVAIIKPFKVTELVDLLHRVPGFPGMTVVSGRGFGRSRGRAADLETGANTDFNGHEVVLVAAPEDQARRLAELIAKAAHTGRPGDGKVLIVPIEAAFAITTGEQGELALG